MRAQGLCFLAALLLSVAAAAVVSGAEGASRKSDELVVEEVEAAGRRLNVAVISLPFMGHFLPVKAIGEKLARRGHNVTLLIENTDWCASPVRGMQCVKLPTTNLFPDSLYHDFSLQDNTGGTMMKVLDVIQEYHDASLPQVLGAFEQFLVEPKPDIIISDFSCYAVLGVAAKFDVPIVTVFPLLLRTSLEPLSWLPLLGSEDPMKMGFLQRWKTYVIGLLVNLVAENFKIKEVNAVRAQYGIRPLRGLYEWTGMGGLVFSPTLWGYPAAPHPQWPNHYPVGLLHPELESVRMEDDLAVFLESDHCTKHGAVYVNFGTLAKQTDRAVEEIWQALTKQLSMCIVWKVMDSKTGGRMAAMKKRFEGTPAEKRIYLSKRFASPMAIMAHPSTFVFFTHCGDTSLGESISSSLPVVGIPFFADQGDVCQRIQESGLGIHVGHKHRFVAADVVKAITSVAQNRTMMSRPVGGDKEGKVAPVGDKELSDYKEADAARNTYLRAVLRARKIAHFLGGPEKAAQTIEDHYNAGILPAGNEDGVLTCGLMYSIASNSLFGFTSLGFVLAAQFVAWKLLKRGVLVLRKIFCFFVR